VFLKYAVDASFTNIVIKFFFSSAAYPTNKQHGTSRKPLAAFKNKVFRRRRANHRSVMMMMMMMMMSGFV